MEPRTLLSTARSSGTPAAEDRLHVLLVEDEAGERWLISEVLRSRGHLVTACGDGESAWDTYRADPHPLIVLDLMLPGMDGLELCRLIRSHPTPRRPVVVVVTSKKEPTVLESVLAAGADDYLAKPIDVAMMSIRLAVAEQEVRKQAERAAFQEAIAGKNREIETLFRNLDDVIFSVDAEKDRLIQVSPAASTVLGRTPEELQEDRALWKELLYPAGLRIQETALSTPSPGRSLVHQYQVVHPDGSERWVEANLNTEVDGEGRLLRVDGIISDVTERRRSQEELAARNKELMTLFRISEITMSAPSARQAYEEVVEELGRATGYPVVAVELYDPVRERMVVVASRGIPTEGDEPLELSLHETPSGAAVRAGKPVVETDSGGRMQLDSAHPVLTRLGLRTYLSFPMQAGRRSVGALTLAHTRSEEPDRRLVRWMASVAGGVGAFVERMRAEQALRQEEQRQRRLAERLQQANQELEAFAYSVSHDLRAPLRTMQGFAWALIQRFGDRLDPEARDYAQRIIASGRQSELLINDLLSYSRLTFEEVELKAVDLSQVVDASLELLQGDLDERGARVEVPDDLPRVTGHHTTLVQILSNLLSNAVKFVPEGRTPHVRVEAESREENVRLRVVDNGPGVPPGQEERIFRVFERLAGSAGRPGTGIGLAVVRRGMEKLGGTSGVEPALDGEGSAFWIELPRAAPGRGGR